MPDAKRERDGPYLHQQLVSLQNLVAGRQRDKHGLHAVGAVGSVEAGRQLRFCGRQRLRPVLELDSEWPDLHGMRPTRDGIRSFSVTSARRFRI